MTDIVTKQQAGHLRYLLPFLQAVLVIAGAGWALNPSTRLNLSIYTEQMLIVGLGIALAIAFLTIRLRKDDSGPPPWYDNLLAVLSLASCGYLGVRYPELLYEMVLQPLDAVILSGLLVVLILEGVRRTVGTMLVIIVAVFLAYAMLGHLLPADYASRSVSLARILVYVSLDTSGVIGAPLAVALTIVVPFLLLGQLLSTSGGSDFFTSLSMAMMGRYRGGSAKIAVVASTLFGSISGSAVANVASTGVITIPLMKRGGFSGALAGGIEAIASTGGQLMPPVMGASAFLMAEFLEISYGAVLLAAIIPAFLYYAAVFIQVDLRAAALGIDAIPADRIPDTLKVLREGWYFVLPFVVFLGGLFWLNQRPELAVLAGCAVLAASALAFRYQGKRTTLRDLWESVVETGRVAIDLVVITAAAGLIIGVLNLTGLAFGLSMQLIALSGESLPILLLLAAAISIVLGMGMPTVGVYVLLAALVAPALVRSGVEPLVAHFFILYFGMLSMITPPIALASFTAANIAASDFWETSWEAMKLGWTAYLIPFLFVASPTLLMIGSPLAIVWAVLSALLGIVLVSAGIAGYFRGPLARWEQLSFAAAGLLLLVPSGAWSGAFAGEIIGLLAGGALAARSLAFGGAQAASGKGSSGAGTG